MGAESCRGSRIDAETHGGFGMSSETHGGLAMGAETHGGLGMEVLVPEQGRDLEQGTVPSQQSLQLELIGYFCGCSVARAGVGEHGLVLADTCCRRCRSDQLSSTVPWLRCHKAQGVILPSSQPGTEWWSKGATLLHLAVQKEKNSSVLRWERHLFNFHALNTEFWPKRYCTCFPPPQRASTDADTQWPWSC